MKLSQALRDQSISCERLGSPFMGQLLRLLADRWPGTGALQSRLVQFDGDIGPAGASLPLRIASGLHALVLTGRAPDLAALYPPAQSSDAVLCQGLHDVLADHDTFLRDWIESPPQTNDVRRSAALMTGAAVAAARFGLPLVLSELGASAGLNLMWDRYALDLPGAQISPPDPVLRLTPEWDGPLPPLIRPDVVARAGVDLNPLDPANPGDMLRLTAYLWPDQPHRLALTRAAAQVMTAPITRGDAIDWLAGRLETAPQGHLHLIQHTVAWQYFPAGAQRRGQALIEAAGARATSQTPLGWLSMESDGDTTGGVGAALMLRLWPGDLRLPLGRADFHGRWIRWRHG